MEFLYNLLNIVGFLAIFFVCLSFHEAAHAWAALKLGDPTSKNEGRLSLNPLRHIDWFGTVALPFLLYFTSRGQFAFGYAKPVMVNISNFKNPAKDNFYTAIAGPAANLILAVIFGVIISAVPALSFLSLVVQLNVILAIFNLLPIPPLDGSKLWHLVLDDKTYLTLEQYGPFILIAFLLFAGSIADFVFNLGNSLSDALINLF